MYAGGELRKLEHIYSRKYCALVTKYGVFCMVCYSYILRHAMQEDNTSSEMLM